MGLLLGGLCLASHADLAVGTPIVKHHHRLVLHLPTYMVMPGCWSREC